METIIDKHKYFYASGTFGHYVSGLSVRPSGFPSGFFRLRDNLTWYRGPPPGVDELIKFWARSAQRQGSKVNELVLNVLVFPVYAITQVLLDGISSNLVQGCTTRSR